MILSIRWILIFGKNRILESLKLHSPDALIHVCSSSEILEEFLKNSYLSMNDFHQASYAISKAGTDLLARFYAEAYGMNVLTTRMFTHKALEERCIAGLPL